MTENNKLDKNPVISIDYRIKLLYAIGVTMVVLAHCRGGGVVLLFDWFPYGGLHVALFIFCSGYLYKDSSEDHIKPYVFKKIKRLIIPLYLYNFAYGAVVQLLHLFGVKLGGDFTLYNLLIAPLKDGHQFIFNLSAWFIIPLFMIQIVSVFFRKALKRACKKTPEGLCLVLCILLGTAGNQLAIGGHNTGWELVLVRMLHLLPFYAFGIYYRHVLNPVMNRIPNAAFFSAILIAKLLVALYLGKMPDYTSSWCSDFVDGPLMPIITGLLGILFYMRVADILEPVTARSRTIQLIADNTYAIMINHLAGIFLLKTVYAAISKYTSLFADFDWLSYRGDVWWYYEPGGVSYTLILYVIVGMTFPLLVQKVLGKMENRFNFTRKSILFKDNEKARASHIRTE